MNKNKGIFVVLIAGLLTFLGYELFFKTGGVENALGLYVSSVVNGFMRGQKDLEEELKLKSNARIADGIAAKWKKVPGKIFGVSDVIFGEDGKIVVVREQYDVVVLFTPSIDQSVKWRCDTYPRIKFETLCSQFNRKQGLN